MHSLLFSFSLRVLVYCACHLSITHARNFSNISHDVPYARVTIIDPHLCFVIIDVSQYYKCILLFITNHLYFNKCLCEFHYSPFLFYFMIIMICIFIYIKYYLRLVFRRLHSVHCH